MFPVMNLYDPHPRGLNKVVQGVLHFLGKYPLIALALWVGIMVGLGIIHIP